jgi:hypothetical protein
MESAFLSVRAARNPKHRNRCVGVPLYAQSKPGASFQLKGRKLMTLKNLLTATAAVALLTGPAAAQMYEGWDREAGYDGFAPGLAETGRYSAWDRDDDDLLSENEFSTGMYADWDADNDLGINEDEFAAGSERWYGADHDGDFDVWDEDDSGLIDQNEFGANWNSDYYADWDANEDSLLDENEFSTGVYNTADLDADQYISVEEEGWFEGWFDGDDIEAEIEEVGDVY